MDFPQYFSLYRSFSLPPSISRFCSLSFSSSFTDFDVCPSFHKDSVINRTLHQTISDKKQASQEDKRIVFLLSFSFFCFSFRWLSVRYWRYLLLLITPARYPSAEQVTFRVESHRCNTKITQTKKKKQNYQFVHSAPRIHRIPP